jgi:hypothetical protein
MGSGRRSCPLKVYAQVHVCAGPHPPLPLSSCPVRAMRASEVRVRSAVCHQTSRAPDAVIVRYYDARAPYLLATAIYRGERAKARDQKGGNEIEIRVWGLLIMFGFWRSRPYQTWFIEVFPWEVNPSRPYQTQLSMGSPFEGFPLSPLSNLAFDVKFCASRPRQTQLPGHPIACCELCCGVRVRSCQEATPGYEYCCLYWCISG